MKCILGMMELSGKSALNSSRKSEISTFKYAARPLLVTGAKRMSTICIISRNSTQCRCPSGTMLPKRNGRCLAKHQTWVAVFEEQGNFKKVKCGNILAKSY